MIPQGGAPLIILIGGQKGGSGKSTLACAMAAIQAKKTGREVLLIDADKQASVSAWASLRGQAEVSPPLSCIQLSGQDLPRQVKDQAKRFDDVIIDAGGRDSVELRGALVVADRFFTPATPSQFDAWALEAVRVMLDQVEPINPALEYSVVINRASTNPQVSEVDDLRAVAKQGGLATAPAIICDRIAHRSSAREGLCAWEYEPKGKAAKELLALHKIVFAKLKEA